MRRDPTEFRARFLRWKNGEQVYKMGIPHYEYGRDALVDDIINTEGFLSTPTDIGDGKITIGSGLTNKKWIDLYNKSGKWTKEDNYAAVSEEVNNIRRWLADSIPQYNSMPDDAKDVLTDITYNIGTGGISRKKSPKFRSAIDSGNWEEAARLMDWGNNLLTTDGRPMTGLRTRNANRLKKFLRAMGVLSNPLDRVNTEQLLEYTANKWLNRPTYMRNDLEKPMNDPDPVGEFLVKARGGMKAASIVGDWLKSRQIRQQAEVYRKIRSGDDDVQNYTGKSLRRLNMRWADLQARDPRYRGITSDNPFTWLYDLFVDPVVQYYTKMQKHPIIGPLLP